MYRPSYPVAGDYYANHLWVGGEGGAEGWGGRAVRLSPSATYHQQIPLPHRHSTGHQHHGGRPKRKRMTPPPATPSHPQSSASRHRHPNAARGFLRQRAYPATPGRLESRVEEWQDNIISLVKGFVYRRFIMYYGHTLLIHNKGG